MSGLAAVLVAVLATTCLHAAPVADRVRSLPLAPGALRSAHYSGYLPAANGSFLHYYLVEAEDVDPRTAPLVWWTNGGPGCSSMGGWGYEQGPFEFKKYNASGTVMRYNEFTWAKRANVVFVEDPPGVGFSYREGGNYSITDTQNAENNYAALLSLLYDKFPEFKPNRFFVAGESYGGIYVPTLADVILQRGGVPGFEGILVGNGVTSDRYDDDFLTSDGQFAAGHGFLSPSQWDAMRAVCNKSAPGYSPNGCQPLMDEYYTNTKHINTYDAYGHCFAGPDRSWLLGGVPSLKRRLAAYARAAGVTPKQYIDAMERRREGLGKTATRLGLPPGPYPPSPPAGHAPCLDAAVVTEYLNRADVKTALHVPQQLRFSFCYQLDYTSNVKTVVPVYQRLLASGKRILIYNGNTDMAVPYTGTVAWMKDEAQWTSSSQKAWNIQDPSYRFGPQLAGWVSEHGPAAGAKATFVMVQGAGHMVPQMRPAFGFEMFNNFIEGRSFTQ